VLKSYLTLSGGRSVKQINEILEDKRRHIIKKYLYSPYIDKKLYALNQVIWSCETNSPQSNKLELAKEVIEYIISDANPELISRIAPLFIVLAKYDNLSESLIDQLWNTCIDEHKHEAVVEATLGVIENLAKLHQNYIDMFTDRFSVLETADEKILVFLKNFYSNVYGFKWMTSS